MLDSSVSFTDQIFYLKNMISINKKVFLHGKNDPDLQDFKGIFFPNRQNLMISSIR